MVLFFQDNSLAQGLQQGLGQGLGGVLRGLERRKSANAQKEYGNILTQTLEGLGEDAQEQDVLQAILSTVKQGVPFDMTQGVIKDYSTLMRTSPQALKRQEKTESLEGALETISKMKELIAGGNVGTTTGIPLDFTKQFGRAAEDRAALETYGRSLIPFVAKGVPIRNQKEFEEYKKTITNPNAQIDKLRGAVKAIEDMVQSEYSKLTSKKSSPRKTDEIVKESITETENPVSEKETLSFTVEGKNYQIPKNQEKAFRSWWKKRGIDV